MHFVGGKCQAAETVAFVMVHYDSPAFYAIHEDEIEEAHAGKPDKKRSGSSRITFDAYGLAFRPQRPRGNVITLPLVLTALETMTVIGGFVSQAAGSALSTA